MKSYTTLYCSKLCSTSFRSIPFPCLSHSSMAPISKPISFLFLTTLLLSLHVNARDSQFFSKVTPVNNNNNNNNLKETQVPNNEGPVNKPEQQPVFIPETENSYGLYGHETGLHPPTTTTTTNAAPYTTTTNYQPYKTTSSEEDTSKYSNNNNNYNKDAYNTNQDEFSETRFTGTSYNNNNYHYNNNNNNNNNNHKDAVGGNQNELRDTKYTEEGYNSMENQNNNNNKHYYNNNAASANDRYFYNNNNNDGATNRYYKTDAVNYNYNGERQGLSDTRFMEGGKYFYDVNSDKNHHSPLYGGSSRGVASENWNNNKGYFGNSNNVNSYENNNSMEGYQNQEVFEDDQEDFEP
ncbi:hypothetical protein RJT34_04458 [Clitoria ternatea]|uniref:Protein E6 n=1 Tax=Clitoria ternatea TaxID=43366 RepID=A0AAN9KP89_CLITE